MDILNRHTFLRLYCIIVLLGGSMLFTGYTGNNAAVRLCDSQTVSVLYKRHTNTNTGLFNLITHFSVVIQSNKFDFAAIQYKHTLLTVTHLKVATITSANYIIFNGYNQLQTIPDYSPEHSDLI